MDTVSYRGPAKRRRLDGPVNSQPLSTSTTVPNADTILRAQPAPYGNVPHTLEVLGPWTRIVHPNKHNNGHISQHYQEFPPLRNDFDVLLAHDTQSIGSTVLYSDAIGAQGLITQFDSFRCQINSDKPPFLAVNPPNKVCDDRVGDNGSNIREDTVICFGMVSILPLFYYNKTWMALTLKDSGGRHTWRMRGDDSA